ncbi:ankyrin repeat domain-containing protein [Acidisphaera sp. L21]|uniref:ankyrin repeat domain-containing protein n=1 Tax=Acidisphaera sp. L21 TaxID=1641851 RepID=UPI0020B11DD2|nr:ankyrin repeat domain-containing protein [Acidisphaera sp. L21]
MLFYAAARDGDVELLGAFLDAGTDPNRPDDRGFPPLILASYNEQAAATALLLARGAVVDAVDAKGSTALGGVAFKGYVDIAGQLLAAGAAVDAPNEAGRTPLMFATMFGRAEMAALLIQHGADPNRLDAEGNSAADIARQSGRPELVAALGLAA